MNLSKLINFYSPWKSSKSLFLLKSSEKPWFSDNFRGNRSQLIRLTLTITKMELFCRKLGQFCWTKAGYLNETSIALQPTLLIKFVLEKMYLWLSGFIRGTPVGSLLYKSVFSHKIGFYKIFSKTLLGLRWTHVYKIDAVTERFNGDRYDT